MKTVIEMAREAGLRVGPSRDGPDDVWGVGANLERFAELVRADERKAMMQLFTDPENQPTQHGTVTVDYMQREIAAQSKELAALREFAAGRCTIQKVIDELGPMSLWSYAAMERRLDEVRVDEREACAKVCDDLDDDLPDGLAGWQYGEAIRARGETK